MKIIIVSFFIFCSMAQEYEEQQSKDILSKNTISLNREYLYNTIIEIFGNKSASIAKDNILTKVSQFGGPCDVYEQVRTEHDKILDTNKSCFSNKSNHKSNINVKSNILRSGFIFKTCKSITLNDSIMNDFFMKRGIVPSSGFDGETLNTIHQSFYPFEKVNQKQENAMKKLFQKANKSWRSIVMTYCLSPGWKTI